MIFLEKGQNLSLILIKFILI